MCVCRVLRKISPSALGTSLSRGNFILKHKFKHANLTVAGRLPTPNAERQRLLIRADIRMCREGLLIKYKACVHYEKASYSLTSCIEQEVGAKRTDRDDYDPVMTYPDTCRDSQAVKSIEVSPFISTCSPGILVDLPGSRISTDLSTDFTCTT